MTNYNTQKQLPAQRIAEADMQDLFGQDYVKNNSWWISEQYADATERALEDARIEAMLDNKCND